MFCARQTATFRTGTIVPAVLHTIRARECLSSIQLDSRCGTQKQMRLCTRGSFLREAQPTHSIFANGVLDGGLTATTPRAGHALS